MVCGPPEGLPGDGEGLEQRFNRCARRRAGRILARGAPVGAVFPPLRGIRACTVIERDHQ